MVGSPVLVLVYKVVLMLLVTPRFIVLTAVASFRNVVDTGQSSSNCSICSLV